MIHLFSYFFISISFLLPYFLFPSLANADLLRATRTSTLKETEYKVAISFEEGIMKARVRRRINNSGNEADQAVYELTLPQDTIVRDLKIFAAGRWYPGEIFPPSK